MVADASATFFDLQSYLSLPLSWESGGSGRCDGWFVVSFLVVFLLLFYFFYV